jgi:hypothetical protein
LLRDFIEGKHSIETCKRKVGEGMDKFANGPNLAEKFDYESLPSKLHNSKKFDQQINGLKPKF